MPPSPGAIPAGVPGSMSEHPPARPLPHPTEDTRPFWDGCARGELLLQRCDGCGHHRFPPAPLCPRCWERQATWIVASGRGVLRSHVVFHQQYHPAFSVPYVVGLVDLEEGPSLYAPVVGATDRTRTGVALVLDWETVGGEVRLPRFRVAEDLPGAGSAR